MRPNFSINRRQIGILTLPLLLGLSSASEAEYLIYLKGGHFIVADDCTFSTSQGVGKGLEAGEQPIGFDELTTGFVEDCTQGKPEGQIFWSTINGNFGEVNADDVYAIIGTKTLTMKEPLPGRKPLEDYVITNRGKSFVNAKIVEQKEDRIYGVKRDDLANINRRGVTGIAPEGKGPTARAEGLCLGEPAVFSVTEMELYGDFLNFHVKNLLPKGWKPAFDLWVLGQVPGKAPVTWKYRRSQKIEIDPLPPDGDAPVSVKVEDQQLLGLLRRALDPEVPDPKLQVCAIKVKDQPTESTAGKSSTMPSP